MNHYCCRDCRIAPAGFKCYSSPNYIECFESHSFCDGKSRDCPSQLLKRQGSPCNSADYGKCSENGQCYSLCQQNHKQLFPCKCPEQEEKCMICCRNVFNNQSDNCRPISRIFPQLYTTPLYLSNGRSCYDGLCENVTFFFNSKFFPSIYS